MLAATGNLLNSLNQSRIILKIPRPEFSNTRFNLSVLAGVCIAVKRPYLRGQISNMAEHSKTLNLFRKIGNAEGVSFLLLVGIAMPIKYVLGIPEVVRYLGWAHGILFVVYCYMVVQAGQEFKWSFGKIFLAFLAALLPFGPFVFDRVYLRK